MDHVLTPTVRNLPHENILSAFLCNVAHMLYGDMHDSARVLISATSSSDSCCRVVSSYDAINVLCWTRQRYGWEMKNQITLHKRTPFWGSRSLPGLSVNNFRVPRAFIDYNSSKMRFCPYLCVSESSIFYIMLWAIGLSLTSKESSFLPVKVQEIHIQNCRGREGNCIPAIS